MSSACFCPYLNEWMRREWDAAGNYAAIRITIDVRWMPIMNGTREHAAYVELGTLGS